MLHSGGRERASLTAKSPEKPSSAVAKERDCVIGLSDGTLHHAREVDESAQEMAMASLKQRHLEEQAARERERISLAAAQKAQREFSKRQERFRKILEREKDELRQRALEAVRNKRPLIMRRVQRANLAREKEAKIKEMKRKTRHAAVLQRRLLNESAEISRLAALSAKDRRRADETSAEMRELSQPILLPEDMETSGREDSWMQRAENTTSKETVDRAMRKAPANGAGVKGGHGLRASVSSRRRKGGKTPAASRAKGRVGRAARGKVQSVKKAKAEVEKNADISGRGGTSSMARWAKARSEAAARKHKEAELQKQAAEAALLRQKSSRGGSQSARIESELLAEEKRASEAQATVIDDSASVSMSSKALESTFQRASAHDKEYRALEKKLAKEKARCEALNRTLEQKKLVSSAGPVSSSIPREEADGNLY